MDTLLRNPAFLKQVACFLGLSVALALIAFFATDALATGAHTSGLRSPALLASIFSLATGLAATLLFCAFSHHRYEEIARLSTEIDSVLHEGRPLVISDYREGDVAVLRNEVGKVCTRLSKTAEDLAAEKRALADALADISHQIRTPLTAVELMVPVIEQSDNARERATKLRELETLIDRVSWLVTSLLKIARIDAGAIKLTSQTASAANVAHAAAEPLAIAFDLRDVACEIHADPGATFTGDAAWTAEALSNVLKNCMEHTPAGGKVRIEASEDAVACRFRIQDSGPGIAEADLPHIFERFYRGVSGANAAIRANGPREANKPNEASRTNGAGRINEAHGIDNPDLTEPTTPADYESVMRPEGFGIGLSLAQALINAQDGSIRASNAPQGGARFDIVFPKMTV